MKCLLVKDYVLYIIMSKLLCSHSAIKDKILYYVIKCSVVYKINTTKKLRNNDTF